MGAGVEDMVIVLADPFVDGLGSLDPVQQPPRATLLPISEALEREWETDAHLVLYRPTPLQSDGPVYRLKKGILADVRRAGGDVLVHIIAIDWDTGVGDDHVPWDASRFDAFEDMVQRAEGTSIGERLKQAAVFYTTTAGCRWLFRLDPPIKADLAEPLIRGIRAEFHREGIMVDASGSVANWAQPFRLPRVTRVNKAQKTIRTGSGPFFMLDVDLARRCPAASIEPVGKPEAASSCASILPIEDEEPDSDEVKALLWTVSLSNKPVQTEFQKLARHRLSGRECFAIAFETAPITEGSRSDSIQKFVGQAVSLLMPSIVQDGFPLKPRHIYALFHDACSGLTPDQGTPSWTRHLWQAVCRYWGEEDAKIRGAQEDASREEIASEEVRKEIQEGAAEWLDLPEDPVQARATILQHAIVHYEGRHYVMDRRGRYGDVGVSERSLHSQVELLGMHVMIPLRVDRADGRGDRPTSYREMTEGRMVNASDVVLRGQLEAGGGHLEFLPGHENPRLVLCAYRRRTDLEPTYSADVDLWFHAMVGPRYEFFCFLLGCWLAFERGAVPAMAFVLPSNSGKNLLMRAMQETLVRPAAATGRDIVGRYQANLSRSPFVFVNEGWPKERFHQHDPSDITRSLVTGDQMTVDEKYQPIRAFDCEMRVGLFANNTRVLTDIVRGSELGPDDQEALAVRLCYFPPRDDARKLFTSRGGKQWTKGWVGRGEQSKGSDFIVAKHLLWLWEKHGKTAEPTADHHLLAPGDGSTSEIMHLLRAQGGSVPALVEVILAILRNGMLKTDGSQGVWIDEATGEVAMTTAAILEKWRESKIVGDKTTHAVSSAVRSLVVADRAKSEPQRLGTVQARWHFLDVEMLNSQAERHGWGCDRLDKIVEAHRTRAVHVSMNGNGNGAHVGAGVGA